MTHKDEFPWCARRLMRVALAAGALLLLAALVSPDARAATITVTTGASGTGVAGDCTLQEAIQAANTDAVVDACAAGSGADVIIIGNCTVTLLGPFQTDPSDGPIGLPDVTSNITIQGITSAVSIIERSAAASDFTFFRVMGGGVLTLDKLTVRNGRAPSGGALINRGTVSISNSAIDSNQATGAAGGGAIANLAPGSLTISSTSFTGNTAPAGPGGAIRNETTLNITSTDFTNNNAGTIGGAIDTFVAGAPVSISNTTFFGNEAILFGGAVHHHQSPLTITNSMFLSNTAGSFSVAQAGGGAIEGFGAWTISDTTFSNNLAFSFNVADGGVLRYIGDSLAVDRCTFSNNTAQSFGGAIELNGGGVQPIQYRIRNSTISGNSASGNSGGGINLRTGALDMNNNTITGNFSPQGGGIALETGSGPLTLRNTIVAANDAETAQKDCSQQVSTTLTSQGHNLIGISDGCTIVPGAGDIIGTGVAPVDPMLGLLQNNGGPTFTHALRPGSPAANAGDPGAPGTGGTTCEATDQRGAGRPDPVFGVCDVGAFEGMLALANLSVAQTDMPDPATFGQNITYTITVTNNGPDTAPGVTVSDMMPNATGFVSATPSQGSCPPPLGAQLSCNLGNMTNGSVATVSLIFNANQAGTLTNSASVNSPSAADPNMADNLVSATSTVQRDFDLNVLKTGFPDPVTVGNNISYSISVVNQGVAALNNVDLTDTFSGAAVSVVSATPSQGSCTTANPITCNLGVVAGQSTVSISVIVTATAIGTVSNTASATTTDTDPDLTNNSATDSVTVRGTADLSITNMDAPDPVTVGANITYTIVVTNNGPDTANGVTVSDSLGVGATGVSIMATQGTCGPGAGQSSPSCNLGALASGASATVTFVVSADFFCMLPNTASVSANEFDTVPGNNSASTTTTVVPQTCITFDNDSGDGLWTTATNWSGDMLPGPANCVVIPAGLTAALTTGAQMVDSLTVDGTLNISGGSLDTASAFTVTGTLNVSVPTETISSTFMNNGTVNVNSGKLALNGGGSSGGSFAFPAGAILEFGAGMYTLTGTSSVLGTGNGTVSIAGATVDVAGSYNSSTNLSAGTLNINSMASSNSFFMTGGTQGGTGTLTVTGSFQWNGGSLVGSGVTRDRGNGSIGGNVTLNGRTLSTEMFSCWCGGTISVGNGAVWNIIGLLSIQSDESLIFNQGGANLQMNNNSGVVQKTQSASGTSSIGAVFTNNGGTVAASAGTLNFTAGFTQASGTTSLFGGNFGGGITFNFNGGSLIGSGTITGNVSNTGAAISPGVPTVGTLSINGDYAQGAAGTLNIKLGGAGAGQFDVLSVDNLASLDGTLNVSSFMGFVPMSGESFQVMSYSSAAGDFAATNNLTGSTVPMISTPGATDYVVSFQAVATADLIVTKSDAPDPVLVGSAVTYTIIVSNGGPDPATSVMLTDTLPASTTLGPVTTTQGTCTPGAGTVDCNLGTVNVGSPVTVTIEVTPAAAAAPSITNTVTVSAAEVDPNATNNTATQMTAVTPVADLAISKADSPDPVAATANLTYTVMVANLGPSPATGVTLDDVLPAGVNFVSAAPSQGTCTPGMGTATCSLGALNANASATVTIVVTPTATGMITNIADVSANETDPNPNNNTATQDTTVVAAAADVQVTKTDAPDPVIINQNLTYTVTVRNNGPQAAQNVVLTDTLPAGPTFISATAPCAQAAGTVTCNLGTFASGAQTVITIVVQPLAAGSLTNMASVSSTTADPNAANNSASATTMVSSIPFSVSFPQGQPGAATVNSGGVVTVTVTVTPNQPGIVVTVACGPPLPPDTTCTSQPPVLVFNNLTPQTATITIQTTLCILGTTPPRGPQFPMGDIRVMWPMLLVLTLLLWVGLVRRDEQLKRLTPVVVLLLFAVLLSGCAAAGGPVVGRQLPIGTLPGTYTVPMTFSSGGQSQTLNFTLTVNP